MVLCGGGKYYSLETRATKCFPRYPFLILCVESVRATPVKNQYEYLFSPQNKLFFGM